MDSVRRPSRRTLAIDPEEIRALMEDLGVDEDVARGMIAVRLGFTDNVTGAPSGRAASNARPAPAESKGS